MYKKLFKFVIVYFTILSITPALTVKASELEADQASQNNSFSELSEDSMVQLFTAVEKLPEIGRAHV